MSDPISLDTRGRTADYDCHEVAVDRGWTTGDSLKAAGVVVGGGALAAGGYMAVSTGGAAWLPAAGVAVLGAGVGAALWLTGSALNAGRSAWDMFNGNDRETQCNPLAHAVQRPNPALAGVSLRQSSFA
ncbi:MAG: hypothetical protein AAFP04_04085 [Myxococcota bacterium]